MRLHRRLAALLLLVMFLAGCGVVISDRLSDAQQVIADLRFGTASELQVTAAIDQPGRRYRTGEALALTVQVTKPAYVAVLRVMPSGETVLVFPNRKQTDARVAPGMTLQIPASGLPLTAPQPGSELFEIIASEKQGSWLFTRRPTSGDFVVLGSTTRELARDIVTSLKLGPGNRAAGTHFTITVGE